MPGKKPSLFLLLFLSISIVCSAQNENLIQGYVDDAYSGAAIDGVHIAAEDSARDISNDLGFFRFTLSKLHQVISFSHVGYETESVRLVGQTDTTIIIYLSAITLPEIEVRSTPKAPESKHGEQQFDRRILEKMPVVLGAVDPVKALIHLPGISQGLEGTSNIIVRGGEADQNLLLLDNLELFHKSHLFGFNSSLNGDIIDHLTVYKNYFPPRFGGRLSSILYGRSRTANLSEKETKFSIGLLNSSVYKNIPTSIEKSALQLAARTSYQGFILAPFLESGDPTESRSTKLYFAEMSGKYSHTFSEKSRLEVLVQMGFDIYGFEVVRKSQSTIDTELSKSIIRSRGLSAEYVQSISPDTKFSTSVYNNYSINRFTNEQFTTGSSSYLSSTDQTPLNVWGHKSIFSVDRNEISGEVGVQNEWITISPQQIEVLFNDETGDGPIKLNPVSTHSSIHSAFFEVQTSSSWGRIFGGVRSSYYQYLDFNYWSFEPRLGLSIKDCVSIYYNKNTQFYHALNSLNSFFPLDYLLPSNHTFQPQVAHQISADVDFTAGKNIPWKIKVSPFHKSFESLSQIRPGQPFLFNINDSWKEFLVSGGTGSAYGIEFLTEGNIDGATSRLSYTYIKSRRQFDAVNQGNKFPSNFDRPHDIRYQLIVPIKKKIMLHINGQIASGLPVTLPTALQHDLFGSIAPAYSSKNNDRLPTYHRLDILLHIDWISRSSKNKTVSLGMYNVYGRKNIINILYDYESLRRNEIRGRFDAFYMLRFVPSINYTVSW